MTKYRINPRLVYATAALLLLIIEMLIALFVHDDLIRPYGGDTLVTVAVAGVVRITFPNGMHLLSVRMFLLAAAIEIGQYFRFVELIRLGDISFFPVRPDTSFLYIGLVCYAVGWAMVLAADAFYKRRSQGAM